jgi:hypothetical protein
MEEKMNWKKSLCVVFLTGAALTAMVGCSQAETTVPAAVQTPSPTQPGTVSQMQTLPSGASFNGTMPVPPSGNFTGTRPTAPTMDLAAAAAELGITETQLSEALGNTQSGFPDMAAAAAKLGVSEDSLRQALGFSDNGTLPGGTPPGGSLPPSQGK